MNPKVYQAVQQFEREVQTQFPHIQLDFIDPLAGERLLEIFLSILSFLPNGKLHAKIGIIPNCVSESNMSARLGLPNPSPHPMDVTIHREQSLLFRLQIGIIPFGLPDATILYLRSCEAAKLRIIRPFAHSPIRPFRFDSRQRVAFESTNGITPQPPHQTPDQL